MPLNYNSRSIHDLVTDLGVGFMDWADYDAAVRVGMPAHRPCVTDEKAFQAQYPDHPLNYYNRSRRIAAADAILRAARERPNSFPEDVLRSIHRVLFDCSAIVRDSLAQALFLAGDESSVAPLTELLRLETESDLIGRSEMVSRHARAAVGRCAARGGIRSAQPGKKRILVISSDCGLVCSVYDAAEGLDAEVVQSLSGIDLIGLPADLQVVEVDDIASDDWGAYLEYLKSLDRMSGRDAVLDCPELLEAPTRDDTPMILLRSGTDIELFAGCEVLKECKRSLHVRTFALSISGTVEQILSSR